MDNATINTKGTKRGLDKLESIIGTKNFRRSRILSDNLHDEVGDSSDNLKAVVQKLRPNLYECNHQQTRYIGDDPK